MPTYLVGSQSTLEWLDLSLFGTAEPRKNELGKIQEFLDNPLSLEIKNLEAQQLLLFDHITRFERINN